MQFNLKKVEVDSELINTVDGRDLQASLGNSVQYSKWISRAIDSAYLVENVDYTLLDKIVQQVSGAKHRKEYYLTLESAKAIAMMQRSLIGKEVRDYFIALEKRMNNRPEKPLWEQLIDSGNALKAKELELQKSKKLRKKLLIDFTKQLAITGLRDFKDVADIINKPNFGRNNMMRFLRDQGWLLKSNKPSRKTIASGYFVRRVFKQDYLDGTQYKRDVTFITEKGVVGIIELYNKTGSEKPPMRLPAPKNFRITHACKDYREWQSIGWTKDEMVADGYATYEKVILN